MIAENSPRVGGAEIPHDIDGLFDGQPETLNILWANESSVISGPINKLMHTAPLLTEAGHDLTILLPDYDQAKLGKLGGATVERTGYMPVADFQLSVFHPPIRIKNKLKEHKFDVVHVATPMRGPFGQFFLGGSVIDMAYKSKLPIVAGAQSFNRFIARSMLKDISEMNPLLRPATLAMPIVDSFIKRQESRMHGRATVNYSPSEAMDEYILERKGVSPDTLTRLANGIDDIFNRDRRDLPEAQRQRRSWGVEEDELVIFVPGRLAAEKSLGRLKHISDIPGTKLVLAGDGPERKNLEELLPNAVFTGMLRGEEFANAYSNADIMVLTSDTESYSQILFEGLASSLPVVVPNSGAFVQLVENGVIGYKFEDADGLIGAVTDLMNDPELREQMGKKGREITRGRTWEEETKKLINIYRLAILLQRQPAARTHLARTAIASLGLH